MSDIFIPGVSDTYKTDQLVKELMKQERIPVVRMEGEVATYRAQKAAWQTVNRDCATLQESARTLFGFQNPFQNKLAESSDPELFTATAQRTALETQARLRVRQLASADRFISRSQGSDFRAPAGSYRFRVGEREVRFRFPGGTLRELAEAVNRRAEGLLKATVVQDTPSSQVFVLEALKTGSRNPLSLHDDALLFGEKAGLVERTRTASRQVTLEPQAAVRQAEGTAGKAGTAAYSVADGTLTVRPGGELTIPLDPPLSVTGPRVLELEVRTELLPEKPVPPPPPPPGPAIPAVGGIDYRGIQVLNDPSRVILPEPPPPEKPKRVDDLQVLSLQGAAGPLPLPPIADSDTFQTVQYGEQGEGISALKVRNANTHRNVQVRGIRLVDTSARGEHRPTRALSSARDAVLEMDGVEVTRESNVISDLLPGVTLNLLAESDREATLTVSRDKESIKEALIEMVGAYNRLTTQIDILTRRDENVIEDARFLTEEERKKAREEMGLFMGDLSLMQVKANLQRVMMNPYPTDGRARAGPAGPDRHLHPRRRGGRRRHQQDPPARLPGDGRDEARPGALRPPRVGQAALRPRPGRRPGDRRGGGLDARPLPQGLHRHGGHHPLPDRRAGRDDRPQEPGHHRVQQEAGAGGSPAAGQVQPDGGGPGRRCAPIPRPSTT